MRTKSSIAAVLAAGVIAVAFAGSAVAEDVTKYPIVLTRATHVGQKMHVSVEGSQEVESQPTIGGRRQDPQHKLVYVVFEADAEVLAVDDLEQPSRMAYTISKCEHTIDGRKSTIARAGARLVAERRDDDETYFTVNDRPVGGAETESLRVVIRFDDDGLTHDQLAGSPTPKTPGESWPIDIDATIAAMKADGDPSISPDAITGKITFWEPTERSNVPCLLVDTEFTIKNWLNRMTEGYKLRSAEFTAVVRGLYPTDETLPVMAESERVTIDTVMYGTPFGDDTRVEFHLKVLQRVEREVTPLDAGSAIAVVEEASD